MNAIKAFLVIALLSLAHGCASQGEPKMIATGAEGEVEWGFSCRLFDLSNFGCDVHGKRDKEPSNVD